MSTMVEILQRIVETRGDGCQYGLCAELDNAHDYDKNLVRGVFETWEHFSGNVTFPVPDPEHPGDPDEARYVYIHFQEGEAFLGEYGELRLDLARHLLKELRE